MNAYSFLLEDAGYQLTQVFADLSEEQATGSCPGAMSPKAIAAHLCECYVAFDKHLQGEEHSWGTFQPTGTSFAEILAEMQKLRRDAVDQALSVESDAEMVKAACQYIIAHDYYHVGQLCTYRLTLDPSWNAYSIYQH